MNSQKNQSKTNTMVIGVLAGIIAVAIILIIALLLIDTHSNLPPDETLPETEAPETKAPETKMPETKAPETKAPETKTPETKAPETKVPETNVPETKAPETNPPATHPEESAVIYQPPAYHPEDWQAFLAKYPDTVIGVTPDAGWEYLDKLTFLGDSTTYGLKAYGVLSGGTSTTQVWVPSNGTLTLSTASYIKINYPETGEQLLISECAKRKQPEYLVITLGMNGVSFMNEDYFKSEYGKIIESVKENSPNTKIICHSIYPVCASYGSLESINNEKIDRANRWIVEVAAQYHVKFVDTNSTLRGADGWMPESYHNGDGLHPTGEVYKKILNNLRVHAWVD